jgi:hypothetical protein
MLISPKRKTEKTEQVQIVKKKGTGQKGRQYLNHVFCSCCLSFYCLYDLSSSAGFCGELWRLEWGSRGFAVNKYLSMWGMFM